MTFSSKVKDELLNVETIKPCCILAECYGLLLFGRGFSAGEVYISTENKNVALRLHLQKNSIGTGREKGGYFSI